MKKILIFGFLLFGIGLNAQAHKNCCKTSFSCDLLSECSDEIKDIIDADYINGLVVHPIDCDSSLVYYWEYEAGVREWIWSEDNRVPNDDVRNIFNGAPDSDSYGTPSHPKTPNIDAITASWANANTGNDPSNGTDQYRWAGYFYVPQDETVIGDVSPQNGERFRVWLGDCCSAPKVIYESPEGDDSPFPSPPAIGNGIGDFFTVDKGWHLLIVEGTDRAAFAGFYLTLNGFAYSGPSAVNKPELKCKTVGCDYVLLEDEYDCPPTNCQPSAIIPTESGISELAINQCEGIFENSNIRSGNKFTRDNSTVNAGWEYTDWATVGTQIITSPECETDLQIVSNLGNYYWIYHDSRIYTYYDTRLLINGAVVQTRVAEFYHYDSRRGIEFNDPEIDDIGTVTFHRDNVPANATVEVQFRMRSNYNGMAVGGSARIVWAGIRSESSYSFNVDTEITEITILAPEYWYLEEEFSYSFGIGEAPENAKTAGTEKALQNQVLRIEKQLDQDLEKLFE